MSDLLDRTIEAHGGWRRWQDVSEVLVDLSAVGVRHLKGWPDAFKNARVEIEANQQHALFSPFVKPNQHGLFEGDRTVILSDEGDVIGEQQDPLSTFAGHDLASPWNEHQLLYFAGYAMWTYLTTPFLLRMPGFKVEEDEPWEEGGEVWRRLQVEFPENIRSHSREQTFYFDDRGLLRRHDYSVEIMGGTSSANYATGYKCLDGLVFPMQRRVYRKDANNQPILGQEVVAIDIRHIELMPGTILPPVYPRA